MYKIIGADGKEYGPVTADQLRQWIREGRANAQTKAQAESGMDWKPLSSFPELTGGATELKTPPAMLMNAMPVPSPLTTKTNGMAIAGLVMGILSLIQCCSFAFGTLGVIFSGVGLSQIKKRPAEFKGKGMAVAGLVMSIVGLAINIVLIVIYWTAIVAAVATQH